MKHFKKEPDNIIENLIQPLWLNKHISTNNDHIYYKSQVIEECILFGIPSNSDTMQVLNFVIYMQNIIFIINAYLITHLTYMPA